MHFDFNLVMICMSGLSFLEKHTSENYFKIEQKRRVITFEIIHIKIQSKFCCGRKPFLQFSITKTNDLISNSNCNNLFLSVALQDIYNERYVTERNDSILKKY